MNRKQIYTVILIAFFVGALGSIFFDRALLPWLSSIKGLSFLSKLTTNSPIIITRREEVQLNEGVNLIELSKQAQNYTVSIFGGKDPDYRLLGNGVIMANDGLVFTSKEILGSGQEFQIVLNDGRTYPGVVRALDPRSEIAVITIPATGLAIAELQDAALLSTAQKVLALGKTNYSFTRKFAVGSVTKIVVNDVQAFQIFSSDSFNQSFGIDAVLNSDFVGGPIINLNGKLVGMVATSGGKILISEAMRPALNSYLADGKISRPNFGFKFVNITKPLANLRKIQAGALVTEISGSSAAAGLIASDLITAVNGAKVEDSSMDLLLVNNSQPTLTLSVLRNGQTLELKLTPETK